MKTAPATSWTNGPSRSSSVVTPTTASVSAVVVAARQEASRSRSGSRASAGTLCGGARATRAWSRSAAGPHPRSNVSARPRSRPPARWHTVLGAQCASPWGRLRDWAPARSSRNALSGLTSASSARITLAPGLLVATLYARRVTSIDAIISSWVTVVAVALVVLPAGIISEALTSDLSLVIETWLSILDKTKDLI